MVGDGDGDGVRLGVTSGVGDGLADGGDAVPAGEPHAASAKSTLMASTGQRIGHDMKSAGCTTMGRQGRTGRATGCGSPRTHMASPLRPTESMERSSTSVASLRGRGAMAGLAAGLSFLLPGLGQLHNGQRTLGLVLLVPTVVGLAIGALAMRDITEGPSWLFDVRVLVALIVVNGLVLVWRMFAIIQAHLRRASFGWRVPGTYVTVALLALTVGMHAVPGWYAGRLAVSLQALTGQGSVAEPSVQASSTADPEGSRPPTGSAGATSEEEPAAQLEPVELEQRLSVLLLGTDAAPGREDVLTDTMMVASLRDNDAAPVLISVPRDLYGVPLPGGGVYDAKLNSLRQYARDRPDQFPAGGTDTLKQAIALLLDLRIDHVATVDLTGMREIVDSVGGVKVDVRESIDDPSYHDAVTRRRGFSVDAGTHHMDGELALAYARSRHAPGDDDFVRAGRQQRLVSALRDRIDELGLISALPSLLDVIDDHVRTDIPGDQIPRFARTVLDARWSDVRREVLDPPRYVRPDTSPDGAYILRPNLDAIRERAAQLTKRRDS